MTVTHAAALVVRQQCPDEGVGEPACVLRLGPAQFVAEHAGNIQAGEGPDRSHRLVGC